MVMMLLVLAASFIYAENNVVFASVSPFALQTVKTDWDTSYTSDYGWNVKAGYRRFVGPFLLGADLAYQANFYSETEYVLSNVQLLAKVGGKVVLSEQADLNGEIGAGVEMAVSRHVINFLPVVSGSCSISTYVKPDMAVVTGADLSLTWPQTKDSSYKALVWSFGVNVGLEFDF